MTIPVAEATMVIGPVVVGVSTMIEVFALVVALCSILFIAYQSYLSRKANEASALQSRYFMILESNKFIFENPEYAHLAVGPKRYEAVKKMDLKKRKDFAAYELLLDNFEFYYLIGCHHNRIHAEETLRAICKNPDIRKFLAGPMRGGFNTSFDSVVDSELSKSES